MTKQQITDWINEGDELEFAYNGKKYSLCPFLADNNEIWISFCEFYQDTLDVPTVDELWQSTYKGLKVSDILSSVPKNEVDGR